MIERYMVTMELRGRCECEELDGCPSRLTSEIHRIEELILVLRENPCMRLLRAEKIAEL